MMMMLNQSQQAALLLFILLAACSGSLSQAKLRATTTAPIKQQETQNVKSSSSKTRKQRRGAPPSSSQQHASQPASSALPPSNMRIPAEYEPVSAVLMASDPSFLPDTRPLVSDMAQHVKAAGAEAWITMDTKRHDTSRAPQGFDKILPYAIDSTWTRDFGPIFGLVENSDDDKENSSSSKNSELAIVDLKYHFADERPHDNAMPQRLSEHQKVPIYSTPLIAEGGNLLFDGHGTLFTTRMTYEWNKKDLTKEQVDEQLKSYFGVHTIHALNYAERPTKANPSKMRPSDGTGHIDMFAKIVAPCVVLVAEAPESSTEYHDVLEEAADFFSSLQCGNDRNTYKVHRIPGWDSPNKTWYSYTNSLIVNNVVIVPKYANEALNEKALAAYGEAAPHLQVKFVDSEKVIYWGGAVHCLSRQIPATTSTQINNSNHSSLRTNTSFERQTSIAV